jgi:hypothetical protein
VSYQMDPYEFYTKVKSRAGIAVTNDRGTYTANVWDVDNILHAAHAAGDSPIAAVSYLLERFSDSSGIDIPDNVDSLVELAVMIAYVEGLAARRDR